MTYETAEHEPPSALERLRNDEYSRARFLKMVGGVGAVSAFGMLLSACGGDDDSNNGTATTDGDEDRKTDKTESSKSADGNVDLEIVNYALTLEYLEADFYQKVIESGLFKGAQLEAIKVIGDHEQQHVQALEGTANDLGEAAEKPETKFPLENAKAVLDLAATVENLGAAAYLGQAGRIQDEGILAAALSIHTVEARHAAALNVLVGKPFTPDGAFAKPADMATVLKAVKPFIVA